MKPLTGYELKKAFDQSVRHFWPADQSQIYRTLAQLTEQGCLSCEEIEQAGRLTQKRYAITHDGREELLSWLKRPLTDHEMREPFLVQVFFASLLSPAEALDLLVQARSDVEKSMKTLSDIRADMATQKKDAIPDRSLLFPLATLDYGLRSYNATLEWMDATIAQLQTPPTGSRQD